MLTPMVALLVGLLGLLGLLVAPLMGPMASLSPLRSRKSTVHITFPTSDLQGARFWLVFIQLILSSLVRRFIGNKSTIYRTTDSDGVCNAKDTKVDLKDTHMIPGPTISLSMPFRTSPSSLSQYSRCLSAGLSRNNILSNRLHLHLLLSALTEPAMLLLLATRACPLDPVGSVNVRNRFEIPHLGELQSYLERSVSGGAKEGVVRATLASGAKQVKRGYEHRILADLVIDDKVLYTQIFTMLVFARHKESVSVEGQVTPNEQSEEVGEIRLSMEDPRDWADLSKDWNPIHWIKWAAKAMGFKSLIAHGNHVAARAVEVLKPGQDGSGEDDSSWMEVQFRRPVILPAHLKVYGKEGNLEVREKDKVDVVLRWS